MIQVGERIPDFEADALIDGEIKKIRLSNYKGKRVVLMSYPADFTFICPTELGAAADIYDDAKKLNAEIIGISTDSAWSHYAWWQSSPTVKKVKFPLAADVKKDICRSFGILDEVSGMAFRSLMFIDEEGVLQVKMIYNMSYGRNSQEIIRILQAMDFMKKNPGNVCPVDWLPGKQALKPGKDLIGKI